MTDSEWWAERVAWAEQEAAFTTELSARIRAAGHIEAAEHLEEAAVSLFGMALREAEYVEELKAENR